MTMIYDDIGFRLANERALQDCERHYLNDDSDFYDDSDEWDNYPYDTTKEAYD